MEGDKIALLARGQAGLRGARKDVEALGGVAIEIPADVADADLVEAAAERTERELGPIDIWINCAMCSVFSPAKEMTPAEYKRVTEVTYLGYVYGSLAALKRMLPRDEGIIIQVGSALAYRGIPLQSAYCGAKHAIQGFNDSLRAELLHDGSNIRLTMVQMPALNTPQFNWVKSRLPRKPQPVPPIYQPEVAAEAIYHAAHEYRREWFVGGSTAIVVEGNKLLPGVGDWYLSRQGYDAQQYDGHVSPDRRDNLLQPVDDEQDYGAHGDFDRRAQAQSYFSLLDRHRDFIALAALTGTVLESWCYGVKNGWRGTLAGMTLGALSVFAFGSRGRVIEDSHLSPGASHAMAETP
jgi:short-subunit dehydrogenase